MCANAWDCGFILSDLGLIPGSHLPSLCEMPGAKAGRRVWLPPSPIHVLRPPLGFAHDPDVSMKQLLDIPGHRRNSGATELWYLPVCYHHSDNVSNWVRLCINFL